MLGNSLVEFGGDWNERLSEANGLIVNRGIKGDDAEGMMQRLCQITPYHPRKIFVDCGINDVSHKLSNTEVVALVQELLVKIREQSPKSDIYYFSLLPINESFGRWKNLEGRTDDIPKINKEMEKWCKGQGITYVDLFSLMKEEKTNTLRKELTIDGLHLTEQGYNIWVNKLKELFTVTD